MPDIADAIHEYEYRSAAPLLEPWFGEQLLRKTLRAELEENMKDTVRQRRGGAVDQVRHGDRFVLDLDDGCHAVALYQQVTAGDTPIIVLLNHSFHIEDETTAEWLRRVVAATFPRQPVQQIRFFRHGDSQPGIDRCHINDHFVAGLVRDIAASPLPDDVESVHLQPPDSMAFYETYCAWYHEFWELRPELKPLVRIESRDDMQSCFNESGVRWIMHNDEISGMIAAERGKQFGMSGWYLREKVIAPSHWGRGFSIVANILLARELPAQPRDALWGAIDPQNAPSLRSARRVGRRVIGSTCRL